MRKQILVIGLFRDRLEVALFGRSRLIAARRAHLDLSGAFEVDRWLTEVRALEDTLPPMLDELGVTQGKQRGLVLYESPSAIADCFCFPAASVAEARHAARLAAVDSIPDAAGRTTSATLVVSRSAGDDKLDLSRTAPGRPAPQGNRSHVLAAAEREDVILAIRDVLLSAGVDLIGAVPVQANIAASALRRSQQLTPAKDRKCAPALALLHLAENGSFLVIRNAEANRKKAGALRFTRSMSIGTSALAAALARAQLLAPNTAPDDRSADTDIADPLHTRPGGARHDDYALTEPSLPEHLERTRVAARKTLFEFGLTADAGARHEASGLTARDVLPVLQPSIQRLMVELRQSLRFALDANERANLTLVLSGAGRDIPNLAAALERELGVHVIPDESDNSFDPEQVAPPESELADLAKAYVRRGSTSIDALFLHPPGLMLQQTQQRIQRALWTGAAAALALLAVDSVRLSSQIQQSGAPSAAIQPVSAAHQCMGLGALGSNPLELTTLLEGAQKFQTAVQSRTVRRVNLHAVFQELSRVTPESVRFTSLTFGPHDSNNGMMEASITGIARPGSSSGARNPLDQFIQQLRASALFDSAELTNVQLAAGSGTDQSDRHFEIRLTAIAAPIQVSDEQHRPDVNLRTASVETEAPER